MFCNCCSSIFERLPGKDRNVAEDTAEKAGKAAANVAEAADASTAIFYSNIAAISEAASKIQMPALIKRGSKDMAKSLGDLIVRRIAAATADDTAKYDDEIIW